MHQWDRGLFFIYFTLKDLLVGRRFIQKSMSCILQLQHGKIQLTIPHTYTQAKWWHLYFSNARKSRAASSCQDVITSCSAVCLSLRITRRITLYTYISLSHKINICKLVIYFLKRISYLSNAAKNNKYVAAYKKWHDILYVCRCV